MHFPVVFLISKWFAFGDFFSPSPILFDVKNLAGATCSLHNFSDEKSDSKNLVSEIHLKFDEKSRNVDKMPVGTVASKMQKWRVITETRTSPKNIFPKNNGQLTYWLISESQSPLFESLLFLSASASMPKYNNKNMYFQLFKFQHYNGKFNAFKFQRSSVPLLIFGDLTEQAS